MTNDFTREINAISDEMQQRQRAQVQPFDADYYGFNADDGRLNAALIVLLDRQGRSLRAEVHFYGPQSVQGQNAVLRQSQSLLSTRYLGSDQTTRLYALESGQPQTTIDVAHTGTDIPDEHRTYKLWPVLAVILALFMLVVLVWGVLSLVRGTARTEVPATATPVSTAAAPGAAAVLPADAVTTVDPAALAMNTNNLQPSTHANSAIGVGSTVRIGPGLKSYVRTEAGGDQGEVIGYLQDGETAVVLGGPVWLQGDSDTIVWWYVELEDGVQGWTPANTSQLTLLMPVP